MLSSEEHALALADEFYSAALGAGSWYGALESFARATGSRTGELIAIAAGGLLPFNLMTNIDPDMLIAFDALRGGDPEFNPRVQAGMKAPALKVLAENDFMTPDEHKAHPHYQEFARPWDIPYICLSTLDRRDGVLIGLAVCRSEREGHITPQQREAFAALAPHVRAAVRMHMALEHEAVKLAAGVLDSLSLPAILCDRSGRVERLTPAAEAMLGRSGGLQVRGGCLKAANDADQNALAEAIWAAADGAGLDARLPRTIFVRARQPGAPPLVLDVIRMPTRSRELGLAARVMVVAQGGANVDARRRLLLQAVYQLTQAETEVALRIAEGQTAEAIASARGVAVATVRAQIKGVLTKFGLRRQVELVARLAQI